MLSTTVLVPGSLALRWHCLLDSGLVNKQGISGLLLLSISYLAKIYPEPLSLEERLKAILPSALVSMF